MAYSIQLPGITVQQEKCCITIQIQTETGRTTFSGSLVIEVTVSTKEENILNRNSFIETI